MAITRLFNTVNSYALDAINASAAELLLLDVDAPAGDTTVTFPASATVGQVIGIQIAVASATKACFGAGPVDVRPFSLSQNGECALWSWDGTTWQSIAQYHQPQNPPLEWLTPGGGTTPVNGDYSIDAGSSTITLPDAPADGTFIAVKSTNGSTTVVASGTDAIDQGNGSSTSTFQLPNAGSGAIFVYDGGTWWIPGAYGLPPAPYGQLDVTTNTTLALGDLGYFLNLSSAVVLTVPENADVEWPAWARFEIVDYAGGSTVVGDGAAVINVPAGKLAEGRGTYARMYLERLMNTDEWILSGDLADAP